MRYHCEVLTNNFNKEKNYQWEVQTIEEPRPSILFQMSQILPFTEANTKRVSSLFRQALRTAFDHSLKFDLYRAQTINIRSQFEANKHVSNPEELEGLIKATEAKLKEWKHPDPYIPPCRPGGTKYQRNIPVAREPLVPGDW